MKPHKFKWAGKSNSESLAVIFCEYCGIGCAIYESENNKEKFREKVDEGCKLSPVVLERETNPLRRVSDGYSVLTFLGSYSVLEKKSAMKEWLNTPNSCLVDNVKNEIIEWHDPKL